MQRKIVVIVDVCVCAAANATKTIVMVISTDSYHSLAFFFPAADAHNSLTYKPFSFLFFSICSFLLTYPTFNTLHFTIFSHCFILRIICRPTAYRL